MTFIIKQDDPDNRVYVFSSALGVLTKTDGIYRRTLNEFKRIESKQRMCLGHNGIKLEISYIWKLSKIFGNQITHLNNSWFKEEITGEVKKKKYVELNGSESTTYQNSWDAAAAVLKVK